MPPRGSRWLTADEHEVRNQLVEEWTRRGESAALIASRLGCTPRTVVRIRAALGIAKPAPHSSWMTPDEVERARALLDDGASCTEVARTLGRDSTTILKRFPQYRWTKTEAAQLGALMSAAARMGLLPPA